MKKDVLKGKMSEDEAVEVRKRLVFAQDLKSLKNCDVCIEVREWLFKGGMAIESIAAWKFCYRLDILKC